MSRNCCSRNFSSCSLGGPLCCPGSSCRPSYPSNLVYTTDLCAPKPTQWGSSLYSGCQQTCPESTSCWTSCSSPRTPMFCSPGWPTYPGSLGCGSSSSCSLGYRSRRCYSLACGPSGFRPLSRGVCGFPPLSYGSRVYRPTYVSSRSCYSSCYRPTCEHVCY